MLDQSFTEENLLKTYNKQIRKGLNLESLFFPSLQNYTNRIKQAKTVLYRLYQRKHHYNSLTFQERVKKVYRIIRSLKSEKHEQLRAELNSVASHILSGRFQLQIEQLYLSGHSKPVYRTKLDAPSFFAEKQVQANISKMYNVKQSNRDEIIPQLRSQLENEFPKYIIKTDIEGFYESIDRSLLLKKLYTNPLISLTTRKLTAGLLSSYDRHTPQTKIKKGIPRGIGISAYLSELYLRDFDEKIKKIPDLIYYSRYVDDIVLIFSPPAGKDPNHYFQQLENLISNEKLTLSKNEKTTTINLTSGGKDYCFDYLGYHFSRKDQKLRITTSTTKTQKYKDRIDSVFEKFHKTKYKTPRRAKRLLIKRISFLTGNTKLFNNKGSAFIGIYHTNKWLTRIDDLHKLDRHLEGKISALKDKNLRRRLYKFSYVSGFKNKTFRNFKSTEMSEIVKGWKT